jgi:anaerobic glycerol-3-phosphate dehydrogenase
LRRPDAAAGFSVVGSIAGIVCARLFDKHGDKTAIVDDGKAAIFDVNGALDAARSPSPANDAN